MNKKELATVVALILLIPVWLFIDSQFIKPHFPDPPAPEPTAVPEERAWTETPEGASDDVPEADATPSIVSPEAAVPGPAGLQPIPRDMAVEEKSLTLGNEILRVEMSNIGAGVVRTVLNRYSAELDEKGEEVEDRVHLNFGEETRSPALVYDLAVLNTGTAFTMKKLEDANGAVFTREVMPDLFLERTAILGDGYVMEVEDRWINRAEIDITVPEMGLSLGPMYPLEGISQKFGPYVGVDAMHTRGVGVKHYAKRLAKQVKDSSGVYTEVVETGFDWFAVKNKFFTQVLTFESDDWPGPAALTMRALPGEGDVRVGMAQASARLPQVNLNPGREMTRRYTYYVGPIDMENLKALGKEQNEVIDFRLFRVFVPVGKLMMTGLNTFHNLTGNWGVAIILLTFVVRMLFWPLTQKGAENMKKMSELSPQMKEMREKYKNNPQKLNQEMSKFYKRHKVNPMAGCLPMLVQIPVFISLYGVLRVAVDLRFADFLWINDLSEQEAIFFIAGFPVNILPLTMGATMVLQQRLTPSNMDEQQRKIMMMMPIVFLFITYTMPSGLLLYWTTSNLISIYQTTHTRRRDAKKAAANGDGSASAGTLKPAENPKASKTAKSAPAKSAPAKPKRSKGKK